MLKILFLSLVLLGACVVNSAQIRACRETCSPSGVARVEHDLCQCQPSSSSPPSLLDAGASPR